ncbi:MAG TPA: substrate-binding domain-containing protein [Thermoanaerobaculia bacterium]|nr:substrate-binding domain-containing protein [Thermoanaerobaculia bacterium]
MPKYEGATVMIHAMRREWLARTGALVFSALLALGVQGQEAGRFVIDGSTGVMPLAAALVEAYQERNPGIAIEMGQGLGTGARIQALAEGRIDIALASHGLRLDDITRQGMSANEIARTAVVFAVNASVPVVNLTDQEICDIYAGKTSSWKTLGAAEMDIAPRTRPDSEVDAEVVRANIRCLTDLQMPATVKIMPKTGDMAKELSETAGAIGMTTMTVVEQSRGKIRALSINGIAPSPENVERATYSLVRKSFLVTRATPPPAVAQFLQFVRDPAGEKVIRANGAIPVR